MIVSVGVKGGALLSPEGCSKRSIDRVFRSRVGKGPMRVGGSSIWT